MRQLQVKRLYYFGICARYLSPEIIGQFSFNFETSGRNRKIYVDMLSLICTNISLANIYSAHHGLKCSND